MAPASQPVDSRQDFSSGPWRFLLAALDPDPQRAAQLYHQIRARLIRLLRWRGARFPEDVADEALDQAAQFLFRKGESIRAADKYSYFATVALTTCRKTDTIERREREALEAYRHHFSAAEEDDDTYHRLQDLVHSSLQDLDPAQRELVISYYSGDGPKRIARRKKMARDLALSPTALRIRIHRIRLGLEARVRQILNSPSESEEQP